MTSQRTPLTAALGAVALLAGLRPSVGQPKPCPDGVPVALLLREHVAPPGELSEIRRERLRDAAPNVSFYSLSRSHAPPTRWLRFAIDSTGLAYRVSGFPTLDLEALACRMGVRGLASAADAWRTLYRFAEVLAPFDGTTHLLGVAEEGVPAHPHSQRLLGDSTDFPGPRLEWSQDRDAYGGTVTVMWSYEGRVYVAEWRFLLAGSGRLLSLTERLLAGQHGPRSIAFSRTP